MAARDERRLQTVSDQSFRFQALLTPEGEVLEIDRQALAFWGLRSEDVHGKLVWEIGWRAVHDEQEVRLRAAVETARRGRVVRREAAVWDVAGRRTPLAFSLRPLRDSSGRIALLIADARSLSRHAQPESASARPMAAGEGDEPRLWELVQHLHEPVLLLDPHGRIRRLNEAAAQLLETDAEAVQGQAVETVLDALGEAAPALRGLIERCQGQAVFAEEVLPLRRVDVRGQMRASALPLPNEAGTALILRPLDAEPDVRQRDQLTGLPGRSGLLHYLEQTLYGLDQDHQHTLCYLDLDAFQQLNEHHGRRGADLVLRQAAAELRRHARHGDLVARLEGDDFAVLLRDCALPDARTVAEAMVHAIHELQVTLEDESVPSLSASVGLAPSAGAPHAAGWLQSAKQACMSAKEAGGNRVSVVAAAAKDAGGDELARLFEQARVRLVQQPLVELRDGAKPGHAEVLLRVLGETGDLQAPTALLARAQHNDLMAALDRWVIGRVFAGCGEARAPGPPVGGYSVNLSAASVADPDLLSFIKEQRDDAGVDPAQIAFELAESVLLADLPAARAFMSALRDEGFAVAIDDCGSGGSSLAYLKSLPVDYLKIGGGLVRAMVDDPVDNVLVDAINRIGHLSAHRTIAKWVENDATVKRLRALQIDYGQGFGLAEPMPFQEPPA